MILYGTNDFNVLDCKVNPPCFTIDSLRDISACPRAARAACPSSPTMMPANPNAALRPDRNIWVAAQNVKIRALAKEMQVPLADPEPLFTKDPKDFDRLYFDHVHPNNSGYDHIAEAFFQAIHHSDHHDHALRSQPVRAHLVLSTDFPRAHTRNGGAQGYSGSRIERMKTGRDLKVPQANVQAPQRGG